LTKNPFIDDDIINENESTESEFSEPNIISSNKGETADIILPSLLPSSAITPVKLSKETKQESSK
jgi:hypothetical protein